MFRLKPKVLSHVFFSSSFFVPPHSDPADNPTTNRRVPLIYPHTLQITARGRVVYQLDPHSAGNNSTSDDDSGGRNAQSQEKATAYLAPEYRTMGNAEDQRTRFTESDIEKVSATFAIETSLSPNWRFPPLNSIIHYREVDDDDDEDDDAVVTDCIIDASARCYAGPLNFERLCLLFLRLIFANIRTRPHNSIGGRLCRRWLLSVLSVAFRFVTCHRFG